MKATGEQTSLWDRKRRAGQRLILGFATPGVTDDLRRLVREIQPAGFVLFARNVEEPGQVRELNRELVSLLPDLYPPLLCVDQEGGRVQRVRATEWPSARTVGNGDDPRATERLGAALAGELRAMGFNLDFAPCADVDSNTANPVIGDRSFGRDPQHVARHVQAFIGGMQGAGLVACAKHFPGHGDTSTDSHLDLPVVDKDRDELQHVELVPFRAAVQAGVGAVMTSHVMFPAYDEDYPATLSRPILHGLLREQLGYTGVVLSDDLEMKAVAGRYEPDHLLDLASRATVDLFCVCHSDALQVTSWEHLVRLQESDKAHEDLATDSARRLLALRRAFFLGNDPIPEISVVGCAAHRDLALELLARGQT